MKRAAELHAEGVFGGQGAQTSVVKRRVRHRAHAQGLPFLPRSEAHAQLRAVKKGACQLRFPGVKGDQKALDHRLPQRQTAVTRRFLSFQTQDVGARPRERLALSREPKGDCRFRHFSSTSRRRRQAPPRFSVFMPVTRNRAVLSPKAGSS